MLCLERSRMGSLSGGREAWPGCEHGIRGVGQVLGYSVVRLELVWSGSGLVWAEMYTAPCLNLPSHNEKRRFNHYCYQFFRIRTSFEEPCF